MKKSLRQIFFILFLLSLTFLFTSCAAKPKTTGNNPTHSSVLIGVNLELSGNAAAYGQAALKGINYAADQINENGGIKINNRNMKVKLVIKDNTSNNYQTAMANSNLASSTRVSAIIGPCVSANVAAGLPKASESSVPVLTSQGTSDKLTQKKNGSVQPFAYRACYTDSYQGVILAHFADQELKADTVAILGDKTSDYSAGLIKAFKSAYKGKIVDTQYYQAGDKDFKAIITKLKGENFKALFVPGYYNEAGLIIKQARQAGIKAAIIGPDGFSDDTLFKLAGKENSNDIYYTNHFDAMAPNPKVRPFIDSYQKKYKKEPSGFTALGYDAVYMIKAAIEKEGSANSIKIAEGLANLKDFHGVTGTMSMDKMHNPKKDVIVVKFDHGVKVSAKTVK